MCPLNYNCVVCPFDALKCQMAKLRRLRGVKPAHEIALTVRDSRGAVVVNKTVVIQNPQFQKRRKRR